MFLKIHSLTVLTTQALLEGIGKATLHGLCSPTLKNNPEQPTEGCIFLSNNAHEAHFQSQQRKVNFDFEYELFRMSIH